MGVCLDPGLLDLVIAVHANDHVVRAAPEVLGHLAVETQVVIRRKDNRFHA